MPRPRQHAQSPAGPLRAAIYYRVSTALQASEGVSLETQLAQARALLAQRGWVEAGVWHDVETGRADDRAAYQAMLAQARTWDVLVVWKIDRLGRDAAELFRVAKEIRRTGKQLVSVTEVVNDPFTMGLYFLLAARESWLIGERTRPAMQRIVQEGRHISRPPLGYRMEQKLLVPDTDQVDAAGQLIRAGTVALYLELVRLAEAGYSYRAICQAMNAAGHRTPRGAYWQAASIAYTLRSPVHAGYAYRRGAGLVPGRHEPLLARERWEALQARLDANAASMPERVVGSGPSADRWLLIGRIHCSCGAAMSAHPRPVAGDPRNRYYACARWKHAGVCPDRARLVRRDDAEAAVERWLAPLASLTVPELAVAAELRAQEQRSREQDATASQRASLTERLAQLDARLERLVLLLADGTITRTAYHEARQTTETERARLADELATVPAAPPAAWSADDALERARALTTLGAYWAAMDIPLRRQVLAQLALVVRWVGGSLILETADPRLDPFLPALTATFQRRPSGPAKGTPRPPRAPKPPPPATEPPAIL